MNAKLANRRRRRTAAVLIAVLVCLMVVVLLTGALVQSAVSRQRQLRLQEQRAQAEWLAESALERGAANLRAESDYKGETWQAAAEELGSIKAGAAVIRVETVDGAPLRRKLLVEASYPDEPHRRTLATRSVLVDLPQSETDK